MPDAVGCGVFLLSSALMGSNNEQLMAANRLKLNADKTEHLWNGTCSQLKKLNNVNVKCKK